MIQTDLENAQRRLPELIEAAARGEEVRIDAPTRTGHPVVQLVTLPQAARTPQFGSAHGLVTMADDFDAPLTDFAEYQCCACCWTPMPSCGSSAATSG